MRSIKAVALAVGVVVFILGTPVLIVASIVGALPAWIGITAAAAIILALIAVLAQAIYLVLS